MSQYKIRQYATGYVPPQLDAIDRQAEREGIAVRDLPRLSPLRYRVDDDELTVAELMRRRADRAVRAQSFTEQGAS